MLFEKNFMQEIKIKLDHLIDELENISFEPFFNMNVDYDTNPVYIYLKTKIEKLEHLCCQDSINKFMKKPNVMECSFLREKVLHLLVFFPFWTSFLSNLQDDSNICKEKHLEQNDTTQTYLMSVQNKIFENSEFIKPEEFVKNHGEFLKNIALCNREILKKYSTSSKTKNCSNIIHSHLDIRENWKNKIPVQSDNDEQSDDSEGDKNRY